MPIYSWPDLSSTLVEVCKRLQQPTWDNPRFRFEGRWSALETLWNHLHRAGTGTGSVEGSLCHGDSERQRLEHTADKLLEALITEGCGNLKRLCDSDAVDRLINLTPLIEDESKKERLSSFESHLKSLRDNLKAKDGDS